MRLKRMSYIVFLCMLCFLTGCKKEKQFKTTFPLEQDVITATLEQVGLPGVISESETTSKAEGHTHYVLRSPSETYDGTDNKVFLADISSANQEGERVLYTIFDQSVDSNQIAWEDWKQQIVFATLLYGGFENEEAVFQAFLEKELPDGKTSFMWDAQLPEGYCTVSYSYRSNRTYDENGFSVLNQSAFLRVNIYESCELYQKLRTNQ